MHIHFITYPMHIQMRARHETRIAHDTLVATHRPVCPLMTLAFDAIGEALITHAAHKQRVALVLERHVIVESLLVRKRPAAG